MQLQAHSVPLLLQHLKFPQFVMLTELLDYLKLPESGKMNFMINRLRVDMVRRGDMMSVEDVTEILAIDLLGVIPDDESVVVATNQGEPVVGEDSLAGKCYQNICRRLLGEEVPISDFNHKPGLRSKLSSLFHKN